MKLSQRITYVIWVHTKGIMQQHASRKGYWKVLERKHLLEGFRTEFLNPFAEYDTFCVQLINLGGVGSQGPRVPHLLMENIDTLDGRNRAIQIENR